MSGSWFSSFLAVEEPRRVKVRVKRRTTPDTARRAVGVPVNGKKEVHSEPSLTESQWEAMHDPQPQIPHFTDPQAELEFYKNKFQEQQEQIVTLRKLPHLQERLFEEKLAAETELRLQAEENVKIMMEQRNMAQIMYSNSDAALNTLQAQLDRERSVMLHEIKAIRESLCGNTNPNGQLAIMSSDEIDRTKVLDGVEKTMETISTNVSTFLKEWEMLRVKELQTLSQICVSIEQGHADARKDRDQRVLQDLTDKMQMLLRQSERAHSNPSLSGPFALGDYQYPVSLEDGGDEYVNQQKSENVQEQQITSRLLGGDGAPSSMRMAHPGARSLSHPTSPPPTQVKDDNVLASLLLYGSS